MSQLGTTASTQPGKMSKARWIYIGLPLLILFTVSMIDKSNINVLLANKPFLQDLGIKDGAIKGSLSSIFLITYAIGQFGWGFVVDRIGAFKSGLIGIFFWVVAMVMGGLAESVSALFWSRSILGLSEGVLYPIALTLTAKWFPSNEQAKAQALWFNGNSLGPVIGLPIIAMVAQSYGWRESYHALGAVSLLCLIMFWVMVRNSPSSHYAVSHTEKEFIENGAGSKKELANTGEVKAVLKNPIFWMLVAVYGCISIGFYGISTFLPSYLTEAKQIPFVQSAFINAAGYGLAIIVQMSSGFWSDKIMKRAVFVGGASALIIIFLLLAMFTSSPVGAQVLTILLISVLLMPAALTMTMLHKVASPQVMGRIGGIFGCISYVLAAIGPMVVGAGSQLSGSYTGGFLVLLGFIAVPLVLCLVLMRKGY
ncbi:MFS transporter [Brevibacillus choshinensis]|uniref:MFS transporter n=1 Tax=Brevibacillus choshinensis TaxID=54911 RepID=A0ABX7FQI1_BRECH|nr:MFS transporter [Brevibacillus choshinensis]QRG67988.1 MFS transporter [Brevibacillus choshinensis]